MNNLIDVTLIDATLRWEFPTEEVPCEIQMELENWVAMYVTPIKVDCEDEVFGYGQDE